MKILVIGGGGREHALTWKIRQNPRVQKIYCAPGNGGIAEIAECLPLKLNDTEGMAAFAREKKIDLTVVGPELPLALGVVDRFKQEGLPIFGPEQKVARLETSKIFAKEWMCKHRIPTPSFETFAEFSKAADFLRSHREYPIVIKADGLAAGKGVVIVSERDDALDALRAMMSGCLFGEAGKRVVIERFVRGREITLLALTDGKTIRILVSAMDYKKARDGDRGPNTGGMGAVAPHPGFSPEKELEFERRILQPTLGGIIEGGSPFNGVIYFGLIDTPDGLQVLEYNVRFGDPETQVVLPLLQSDLLEALLAATSGELAEVRMFWKSSTACAVVLASAGYPGEYERGIPISGLEEVEEALIFHAGTKRKGGQLLTDGGRVLAVAALGDSLSRAREEAYQNVRRIHFPGCFYRQDIGL